MACADPDMKIDGDEEEYEEPSVVEQQYMATEFLPEEKGPLYNLMQKQPAVLGSLQMASGFLSIGVGILFALTQNMGESLITLFRLSPLTGALHFIAGIVSSLLLKYPSLLPVSYGVNCSCIAVSAFAACLISVDLAHRGPITQTHYWMEILVLCVLGLEVSLSTVLCFWFSQEKRAKST